MVIAGHSENLHLPRKKSAFSNGAFNVLEVSTVQKAARDPSDIELLPILILEPLDKSKCS